ELQLVEQPAAAERAEDAADAEGHQSERDEGFAHTGDVHQSRRQIGEHAEHAGEAYRADAQGQPYRLAVEVAQLAQHVRTRRVHARRQHARGHRHGRQRNQRHQRERPAPTEGLAEPGRQRVADQQRDRQPQHHPAHRSAALLGRADANGDQRGDAEVRTVRQAGDEAGERERVVARRERAGEVAESVEAHQRQQQ
ncbi:hypothetical protein CATMIT_01989, partial [Catenibacterium mitsuokai DSM 15897]